VFGIVYLSINSRPIYGGPSLLSNIDYNKIMKKIVLIQFRKNKIISNQERKNIERIINKKIKVINIFIDKFNLTNKNLNNIEKIILAGSSEFSFSKKHKLPELYQKINKITPFIKEAIKQNIPILGVCLGHQYIANILGSKIINDTKQKEVGTFKLSLTSEAKKDSLFKNLPKKFLVQEGHGDSIEYLSKKMILLAKGERCKIQSFKLKGKNVYGVQFHPEMNAKDSLIRLKLNPNYYSDNINIIDSPLSKRVLKNFVNLS
jgi:GMP synthase (glutamine-hydrolysing)